MTALAIGDTSWSLGVLVGVPICVLILLGLLGCCLFLGIEHEWGLLAGGFGVVVIFLALVLSPLGFYPYSAEYHQWREVGGTVTKIDKRLVAVDKSMQDKFVVRFEGSGQQYGCDDTRCAGVQVGDSLHLSCKRAWQYTGTDGYDCRFVSTEPAS